MVMRCPSGHAAHRKAPHNQRGFFYGDVRWAWREHMSSTLYTFHGKTVVCNPGHMLLHLCDASRREYGVMQFRFA